MDRWLAMQTLVRVVEMGSFSAAARELGSTQSAVSKQVAALERELGAQLLVRSTRSLKLTEPGARYVEQARRLVAEVAEAEAELRAGEQQLQGWLRVAASVAFGRLKLLPLVQSFLAEHPGVRVDLRLDDGFVDLIEQGIDVAVRIGELPDSSLQAIRVGQVRQVLVASPAYLQAHGQPAHPAELARHTLIARGGGAPEVDWQFCDADRPFTQRLHARMRTSSNDSAIAAAVAGFGITRLLSYQVAEPLRQGRLALVLERFEKPALPIHVVHREGRRATQKVRGFIDLAVETLRADPALR